MSGEPTPEERSSSADIIVPIYGAAAHLARCLASVVRHTPMPPNLLVLVVDGPQPDDVEEVLSKLAGSGDKRILVLRNESRQGFVASVNRGMRRSSRDVVLLNSDTEVTEGWLTRLREAAYSSPRIATVTPLSNAATICSLPEFLEDNLLPEGMSTDEIGEIVSRVTQREYPHLPTGVGVCMYVRRAALDAVGLFDEARFGLGYGEENEFCTRAARAGFVHIADDATFISHAGQASFGTSKPRRVKNAMRQLRLVDRRYLSEVASFMRRDPLEPARRRVIDAVLERRRPATEDAPDGSLSILHIVHGWPPFDVGGTEQYARRLALQQVSRHGVNVFARIADLNRATGQRLACLDRGIRVRLLVNNFDQRNPLSRNAMRNVRFEKELDRFIADTKPDVVHVHHLAGHGASLMGVIQRHLLPVVYQVQDWWGLCARANLWHADQRLCEGPTPTRCADCLPLTGLRPRGVLNRALHVARTRMMRRSLRGASAYVMGSDTVRYWYAEAGMFSPSAPVHVLEYGIEQKPRRAETRARTGGPIVFGFIGALMPHKGAHVAVEAFRRIDPNVARLVVWGNPEADPNYSARLRELATNNAVEFRGRFDESDRSEILAEIDILIVPSVGLESFGIVAREAMAAGVPIIASRRGALEELEIDGVCGATVEPEDAGAITRWINRLVEGPEIILEWRRALPVQTDLIQHAAMIECVYRRLLGGPQ
jgi:glycosyltransferase involved in cell wall biosynthesis/GT2 family glycosyltransferase